MVCKYVEKPEEGDERKREKTLLIDNIANEG